MSNHSSNIDSLTLYTVPNSCSVGAAAHVDHLLDVVKQISSWTTSNLLCLNPSKTEFIVIGLREQLKKIPDPSISFNLGSTSTQASIYSNLYCPKLRCNF